MFDQKFYNWIYMSGNLYGKSKDKVKVVPVLNETPSREDIRGSGGKTPRIHNFGTI
jgi:hypothetical protein